MARRTKKAGMTGKFGPRYGVTVRKQIRDTSRHMQTPQKCPECQHMSVKRESSGIWKCRHCNLVFAAAAYSAKTRDFKKEISTTMEFQELEEGAEKQSDEEVLEDEETEEKPALEMNEVE